MKTLIIHCNNKTPFKKQRSEDRRKVCWALCVPVFLCNLILYIINASECCSQAGSTAAAEAIN